MCSSALGVARTAPDSTSVQELVPELGSAPKLPSKDFWALKRNFQVPILEQSSRPAPTTVRISRVDCDGPACGFKGSLPGDIRGPVFLPRTGVYWARTSRMGTKIFDNINI